ncbi:hypothetical protein FGO68_gene14868 [Halteria grandinella]|uniref:Uncharacterized protein n=1 Tax=Halteria grandinella TaxID=5974 RepID=A0A8J8NF54_HALGN|nr:hypothetical protein FGO68_gene14868 [Halteria grandinella]
MKNTSCASWSRFGYLRYLKARLLRLFSSVGRTAGSSTFLEESLLAQRVQTLVLFCLGLVLDDVVQVVIGFAPAVGQVGQGTSQQKQGNQEV